MGSIIVGFILSLWILVMAAAVLAPMFAGVERSSAKADAPEGSPSAPRPRSNAAPVRLHSDDRIAA